MASGSNCFLMSELYETIEAVPAVTGLISVLITDDFCFSTS